MDNRFTRWWERRSLAHPSPTLLQLFSSLPTAAGVSVTAETALTVPAVFSCCQVLSQDIARTPIRFREKVAEDTYVDAVDHPLFEILSVLPNPEMTGYQFKHAMQWQLLTTGRAFAEIVRVDGRVVALWPLWSAFMTVDRDERGIKRWTYRNGGQTYVWLFNASAPPIFELVSESPILRCREIIGSALALQAYVGSFFKNNARPSGVLQTAGSVNTDTAERLRDYWQQNYGGIAGRGKIPVLDQGLNFTPIQMENDSAQLNETMKALSTAICGAFRVPPWKAGLMESTNYSNMESGQLAYLTDTLDPLFANWEEALRRDLLTSRQFGGYTMEFDRQALLRNDIRSINASLQSGIQNGYLSANDARRAIGLNPIPDGDTYRVNAALQPVVEVPNVA
jgi:HK97 family phage portal protein